MAPKNKRVTPQVIRVTGGAGIKSMTALDIPSISDQETNFNLMRSSIFEVYKFILSDEWGKAK